MRGLGRCRCVALSFCLPSVSPQDSLFLLLFLLLDRQRISLRQNLLTSLFYHPLPSLPSTSTSTTSQTLSSAPPPITSDEPDEDPLDDSDAAKKEADFPYDQHQRAEEEEPVWPLRGLKELEELDLYDNSLKSVKGLEGLEGLTCVSLPPSFLSLSLPAFPVARD